MVNNYIVNTQKDFCSDHFLICYCLIKIPIPIPLKMECSVINKHMKVTLENSNPKTGIKPIILPQFTRNFQEIFINTNTNFLIWEFFKRSACFLFTQRQCPNMPYFEGKYVIKSYI